MYSVEVKNNKEIYEFCMANGITDINKFIQDCFKQGFDIKKYGLLGKTGGIEEKWVEKEVIVEK
jgi:Cu2+-containing amine oxidase